MTAKECVSEYIHKNCPIMESDKLKLVDALTSGMRSDAIIVTYLPSVDRFLLCWRTTAIAAAKLHAAGDAFRSSNSALPEHFLQASLIYLNRHKKGNINADAARCMSEVKSLYREVAQITMKDGNKISRDTEAYRYQLSEWDLGKLLIDGRVPDVRTARFILAVIRAAWNLTLPPEPHRSQSTHSPLLFAGSSLSASSSSYHPSPLRSPLRVAGSSLSASSSSYHPSPLRSPSLVAGSFLSASSSSYHPSSPSYMPPISQSTGSPSRMGGRFLTASSTSSDLGPLSSSFNLGPLSSGSCDTNPTVWFSSQSTEIHFDGTDSESDNRRSSAPDACSWHYLDAVGPDPHSAGSQKTSQSPASDVSQTSAIPLDSDDDLSERRKQGGAKRTSGGAEPAPKRLNFVEMFGDVRFGDGVENGAD